MSIIISAPSNGHLAAVLEALAATGWRVLAGPADGRIQRNGQAISLAAGSLRRHLRVFVYKCTGSGRGRATERRIEITSTYPKGLQRRTGYSDVVLGYDATSGLFVGIDPRRLHHGGRTGNASSFFDSAGLALTGGSRILIIPRRTTLLQSGIEYHAFFARRRLPEYLFNHQEIHNGSYVGAGPFSGKLPVGKRRMLPVGGSYTEADTLRIAGPGPSFRKPSATTSSAAQVPLSVSSRQLSPQQLHDLLRRMEENGRLGEQWVMRQERARLRRAGRSDLISKIRWTSESTVSAGYDIVSFDADGKPRYIEVKSTSGHGKAFDMSDLEWRRAGQLGNRYWIYRVSGVRTSPSLVMHRNPAQLESDGALVKKAAAWLVRIE